MSSFLHIFPITILLHESSMKKLFNQIPCWGTWPLPVEIIRLEKNVENENFTCRYYTTVIR